jgi:hypothetical protein
MELRNVVALNWEGLKYEKLHNEEPHNLQNLHITICIYDDQIKENEMIGTFRVHRNDNKCIQLISWKP